MVRLLTMNVYKMQISWPGRTSGSMEYDFIERVKRINQGQAPDYEVLYQGKRLVLGGHEIHVLWPPRFVSEEIVGSVREAVEEFDEALKEDERLREIYERVWRDEGLNKFLPDIGVTGETKGLKESLDPSPSQDQEANANREPYDEELPPYVRRANGKLRRAANRLSLAYFDSTISLLFLGDLEGSEINAALQYFRKRLGFGNVRILVTAHHGTHWGRELKHCSVEVALSSVGPKLISKVRPEYSQVPHAHFLTYPGNDIHVYLPTCIDFT